MPNRYRTSPWCALVALALSPALVRAQAGPDTILFPNGDKLSGHFESATDKSVKFKSDALGEITVDWSKIKELHTSTKVAVIRKGEKLSRHVAAATIPQGTLAVENQTAELTAPPQPPQSVPLALTSAIVDQPSFEKAVNRSPGFLQDWGGTVTLGAALVDATQDSSTFMGAISLVRAEPTEAWLNPRRRTIFDFTASYGDISQPNTPTVKTSIFHGDAEQDEYFDHNVFAFGRADFDHNFSQGLTLQQTYSGGIGWTVIQTANQELDLKAGVSYVQQQFQTGPDQDIIGSVFAQHFKRTFKRGLVLNQRLTFTPAWNQSRDYSGQFGTLVTMPVFKRVSASTGIIDTFLNDPPPGFQKNSFQFTLGFTYVLK
jgi:Protein of unknown function, DUF481